MDPLACLLEAIDLTLAGDADDVEAIESLLVDYATWRDKDGLEPQIPGDKVALLVSHILTFGGAL